MPLNVLRPVNVLEELRIDTVLKSTSEGDILPVNFEDAREVSHVGLE